jgi:hypothetical protein
MARILVHSATGPDNPTRAALALLIAPPQKLVVLAVWAETTLTY